MKRIYALLVLSVFAVCAHAGNGIDFREDLTWEQAKDLAAREGKMIFIDFYTSYCIPCKIVEKEVFTDKAVYTLMNEKFISLKLQMDSTKRDTEFIHSWRSQSRDLEKAYEVKSFPTFAFINAKGELVHKFSSLCTVPEFLDVVEKALKPDAGYPINLERYKRGERDPQVLAYLVSGAEGLLDPKLNEFVAAYFETSGENYTNTYWTIALKYVKQPEEHPFKALLKHAATVNKLHSKGTVEKVCFPIIYEALIKQSVMKVAGAPIDWIKFDSLATAQYAARAAEIVAFSKAWHRNKNEAFVKTAIKQYFEQYDATISESVKIQLCVAFAATTMDADELQYIHEQFAGVAQQSASHDVFFPYASFLNSIHKKQEALYWVDRSILATEGDLRSIYISAANEFWDGLSSIDGVAKEGERLFYVKDLIQDLNKKWQDSLQLDQELSEKLWTSFIHNLDPHKDIFLQEDIDRLKRYASQLHKELEIGRLVFIFEARLLYFKRLQQTMAMLKQQADQKFVFEKGASDAIYHAPSDYAITEAEQSDRLLSRMKMMVQEHIYEQSPGVRRAKMAALEPEAREAVFGTFLSNLTASLDVPSDEAYFQSYIKIVLQHLDPAATPSL